jgi:hypothetical protein
MIKFTQDKAYFDEEVAAVIDTLREKDPSIARNACMGQGDPTIMFADDQAQQVVESPTNVEKRSIGCGVMALRAAYVQTEHLYNIQCSEIFTLRNEKFHLAET